MATNARKQTIPSGSDASVSRGTIFELFGNSIRDIPAVANTTERAQLVSDLTDKGQGPSASRPLVVYRADAPGLHRLEWTIDGTVWIPSSGVLQFASNSAADSWATSYGGYLTAGDRALVNGTRYRWSGTAWVADAVARGFYVGSTSGTGTVTVNHGLGIEPAAVVVTDVAAGAVYATRKVVVSAKSSSQIQFVVLNGGAALASNPVEFFWVAYL